MSEKCQDIVKRNLGPANPVILNRTVYLLLLLIGLIGLLAMTLLGFSHGGGAHGPHALGGHGPGGGHLAGHHGSLTAHHGPGSGTPNLRGASHLGQGSTAQNVKALASALVLSPLDLFSLCFGAGLAGLLLQHLLAASLIPWFALLGALVFFLGIERPFLSFAMRFVTKPSEGLEGVVAKTATAVTSFDTDGRGLVKVMVDDQAVQVLAVLEDAEIQRAVRVHSGDELVVTSVDSARNTCHVTTELSI